MTSPFSRRAGSTLRIALLVAWPTTFDEYCERLDDSDYLDGMGADGDQPERTWATYAEDIARPSLTLADHARYLGVAVKTRANLAALRQMTSSDFDVGIVVSHWKGSQLRYRDLFTSDVDEIRNRFLSSTDPEWNRIGRRLRRKRRCRVADVVTTIDAAMRTEANKKHLTRRDGETRYTNPGLIMADRREKLDVLLEGLIRPGNRLEMYDGLHAPGAVETSIAPDFKGVLDFTVCQSFVLSDFIDVARRGAVRTVQFEKNLTPEIALIAIQDTLERVHNTSVNYLVARTEVLHAIAAFTKNLTSNKRTFPWFWGKEGHEET